MALFDQGAGFFLGGVAQQQNVSRQLSVQEAQLGLQKTRLGIEMDQSQKDQAGGFIEELVTIAAGIKENFPGTSEEFAQSKAAQSVESLLGKADELAGQTGLPAVDYRAKLSAIPTVIDVAQSEARQDIVKAEAKISASAGDPQKEKALGVGREGARFANFRMPNGKIVAVNLNDPQQIANLPPGAQILTSFGVEATSADALTGQTPKEIRGIRAKIEGLQADISVLEDTREAFKKTPQAGGILGALIEKGTGVLEQLPLLGDDLAGLISDPEERERVKKARTRARLTVANMLETVTNEKSGRFTDTERRIAEEILGALDLTASPRQIDAALSAVLDIMKDSQNRELNKLLTASGADLAGAEGRQKFFDILLKNGFTEEQAVDVLARMTSQRGVKF